jgi:hypothetical protein
MQTEPKKEIKSLCWKCNEGIKHDMGCDCNPPWGIYPKKEDWIEELRDFYWETGHYCQRPLGFDEYVKFISSLLYHHDKEVKERIEQIRTEQIEYEDGVLGEELVNKEKVLAIIKHFKVI